MVLPLRVSGLKFRWVGAEGLLIEGDGLGATADGEHRGDGSHWGPCVAVSSRIGISDTFRNSTP